MTELTCSTCEEGQKDLFRCSGCKVVIYCSPAHQRKSWRSHKPECLRIQEWRKQHQSTTEIGSDLSSGEATPLWLLKSLIEFNRGTSTKYEIRAQELDRLPMELILIAPRLTELHLNMNNLTSFPTSIMSTLTALRTLNLNLNKFQSLPYDMAHFLPNLAYLYVSNNTDLVELPPTLGHTLSSLSISDCANLKVPYEVFARVMLDRDHAFSYLPYYYSAPTQITRMTIHLPKLVDICMKVVKRNRLEQNKKDEIPEDVWHRLHNGAHLCSACKGEYFGPAFFIERELPLRCKGTTACLHIRACSLACDATCRLKVQEYEKAHPF